MIRPFRFATHSKRVQGIAAKFGWLPSARYTNLRDVKNFEKVYFIDIDFKNYSFEKHMDVLQKCRPHLTVARDIEVLTDLPSILEEAKELEKYSDIVVLVPKDQKMAGKVEKLIPSNYLLGYSVPTKYGGTKLSPFDFQRPVHLLGGRPDTQRRLAEGMKIYSFDCNRFTIDAAYGDYFNGTKFMPHPKGGYEVCIKESIKNINTIWSNYNYNNEQQLHSHR